MTLLTTAVVDLHRWDVAHGWGKFNTILGRIDDHLAAALATPDPSIPERPDLAAAVRQAVDYFEMTAGEYHRAYGNNDEPTGTLYAALGSIPERPAEPLRAVTAFLDKYGLSNTSGERHAARRAALALARAALAQQSTPESRDA